MPDRDERWRLVLGAESQATFGVSLGADELAMDRALEALYDAERRGGLGASHPNVARWLGDIRTYFPAPVVRILQKDALERLKLDQLLLEPELLEQIEPDVHLIATLVSLRSVLPGRTRDSARAVVRRVVDELEKRLRNPMQRAVRGALSRAQRTSRPRPNEIDWQRTIRKNLGTYSPEHRTVIAERVVGFASRRASLRDLVLCVDQSGSMASSVVYASIFGAVLASLRSVSTRFVVFDTAVVDLTEELRDPVDLLFGTQLGGGTDIQRALTYVQQIVTRPERTIVVLVTDLYEGGDATRMLARAHELVASGVNVICLLALNDRGAPSYDHANARALAALGIPAFACTPDLFPDLVAAAIQRQDPSGWAGKNGIVLGG